MVKRRFHVTGSCVPQRHYMVRLNDRLKRIKEDLVDCGSYFVISKGRQYGKTTTLRALREYLGGEYLVASLDFQGLGSGDFADAAAFSHAFANELLKAFRRIGSGETEGLTVMLEEFASKGNGSLNELFDCLSRLCENSPHPVVLMIDEVDSASNNQVFIEFLAMLRQYYLNRDDAPAFHSVILAGVYNVKNLKLKLRPESEHQFNSPWNIAAEFKVEMEFSAAEIASMLEEYEADKHTGMDIRAVSEEIYRYTSGYPVLVSSICKFIDEDGAGECGFADPGAAWSKEGIEAAVKDILNKEMPLFGSMIRHFDDFPDMKRMFHAILFQGTEISYSFDVKEINLACMFGYAVNREGKVRVANRIFEMRLYNYFLTEEELHSVIGRDAQRDRGYFIHDGKLDMDMALKKFIEYFHDIYGGNNDRFVEDNGRKIFLVFLRLLTDRPQKRDMGRFFEKCKGLDGKADREYAKSVLEVFAAANKKWIEQWKGDEDMGSALLELMAPELQAAENRGWMQGAQEGRREGRREGRCEGRREGRCEGISGTVTILKNLGFENAQIKETIQKQYQLSEKEITKFFSE